MSKGLREDVEAARGRMRLRIGAGREVKALGGLLSDGERVEVMAGGKYMGGQGLLVLTDRRLMFLLQGMLKSTSEDFPLEKVTSVQWRGGFGSGTVAIVASGGGAEIKGVIDQDGKALVDAARARLSAPTVVPAAAVPDLVTRLSQLAALRDAGVLSGAEFDAKKAELLARM